MNEGYNYTGKRYIALVRASDATEGTTSTQAQLAMLHEKAASLKMVRAQDGEIVLNNVTGSMPGKRQDMTNLIQRKQTQNDFDVLVVQRLDRLTRSGSDHGFWFEHELKRAGIHLYIVGDDIPEGRYASLIKVAKYEAAREQAFSISQRSTQGYQLALEEGRVTTSSHTPYACWRMYLTTDGKPLHIIRDLRDGRQEKLDPDTHAVIDTYGQVGGGSKGHYRKQKHEKVLLMPGNENEIAVIRTIFDLHFRQGWGGKRIADHLNRQSIPSPCGKQWSQRQVEVLYNNEVYTGRSVANRTSSGIYHQRNHATPKPTNLDPSVHATAKTIPVQLRPADEWFVTEQPLLKDLLGDEQLRALAIEGQDRYWRHMADPDRPKLSKSKHKTSDYLLSGILHAKQDGGALVGVPCGRVGKKVRYYRHRRGRTGYTKG
jgi:DNA invertase Pin-like site-specific DNA recombinase